MTEKEKLELINLRKRVQAQREEINRLQEKITGLQPKFGFWDEMIVEDESDKYGLFRRRFYCSACGDWTTQGKTKYCPNCGAKMEES